MMPPGYRVNSLLTFALIIVMVLAIVFVSVSITESSNPTHSEKIDPGIYASISENDQVEFIIFLSNQADLSKAASLPTKQEKGTFVYNELSQLAEQSQGSIQDLLESLGVEYRSFWVANMIWVRGDIRLLQGLAPRADVAHLYSNPKISIHQPLPDDVYSADPLPDSVEWNIRQIHAPEVWAEGFTGQNIVIGGQDTGYDWAHPALLEQYRGWNGQTVAHDYHWHDAIHEGGGVCGADSSEPCDDHGHGTHTMGIMVGDDGGEHKIGVAPGAQWIGCRNMDRGVGSPITYSECYQWFVSPSDLDGDNPDPLKAPHVINNSWSCPPSEGCLDSTILQAVVENVRSAGILTVHAAGNGGPNCGTIDTPAAIYDASFTVGATTSADLIAAFSSRGPAVVDGVQYLKPDVVAPGQNVTSSLLGGGYGAKSGTSMAAPHVAGLAALAISADPSLAADVDRLESFIAGPAVQLNTDEECGVIDSLQIPNNTYGFGRVDALRTIQLINGSKLFIPLSTYAFNPAPSPGEK